MYRLKSLALIVLLLVSASSALAALPPHYQRIAELNAILNNTEIAEAFGVNRPIESVEYMDVDFYRVTGAGCHMFVRIFEVASTEIMVGRRQFDVGPGELHCG